ncbi:hypothetical protein [Hydrogenophaga sp. RWCD_12]
MGNIHRSNALHACKPNDPGDKKVCFEISDYTNAVFFESLR